MVITNYIEDLFHEQPMFREALDIENWEFVGCTGTSFRYGELSTYFIVGDDHEYYWFKSLLDFEELRKPFEYFDAPNDYVSGMLNSMLYKCLGSLREGDSDEIHKTSH